ncbi:alcohol acetyltransferase [Brevibacterium yomogidense]|uniref:alcohol acetyltransferase n=1 Tax=Brevibacterium yomogidense TaxID=946573 RepID=UPI000B3565B5|nr:alcohol acetyltransferase [Brevibacterium yomogidense]
MTRPAWVRLDNASNIFLAARSDSDPKVFRVSAEMDHDVDPLLLQAALEETYDRYPLYHAVMRRGVFWYYLQDSSLRPVVTPEEEHTCAALYQVDRRNLLFRVVHHERRISLEVFHALSDGTGALWFLTDLLDSYVRLRHPEPLEPGESDPEAPAADQLDTPEQASDLHADPSEAAADALGLTPDSFAHYFRRHRRKDAKADDPPTSENGPAPQNTPAPEAAPTPQPSRRPAGLGRRTVHGVHRVRGTRTPDNRTRLVELSMPATQVLSLARAEGVSMTMYLTGLFFEAVRLSSGGLGRSQTIAASVPVNLRQFFPSNSPRNFFATVRVEHTYGQGDDSLGAICRGLEEQFRPEATPEALERKLRRFIRFERMPLLRILPRGIKDVILGLVNVANNRGLTVAVSNLGRVALPEPAESRVRRMMFHVAAVRPQFCSMSHDGILTVSFTSPFTETDHVREFARMLAVGGVDVSVAATRVTEDEVAEVTDVSDAAEVGP